MWACDCTTSLMTHLTISTVRVSDRRGYWRFTLPLPLLKQPSTQANLPSVVAFPFLVHLAWVFKHTPDYNSYLQLHLVLDNTSDLYYSTKGHFYFFIIFFNFYFKLLNSVKTLSSTLTKFLDMSKVKLSEIRYYLTETHLW